MIAKIFLTRTLDSAPDTVSYRILNDWGGLEASSDTDHVTLTPRPNGSQITIEYDVPDLDPGAYQVVFTIGSTEHSTELKIAAREREETGYITLTQNLNIDAAVSEGTWELYRGNLQIGGGDVRGGKIIDAITDGAPSLDSYMLIVTDDDGAIADSEVFWINPMILKAVRELRSTLDRLQSTLRLDALEMDDIDYIRALSRGRDRFNGIAFPTNITMRNAAGPIRGLWLVASQIEAMRVRFLEEGLTNYDYQGNSVNLSVDTKDLIDQYIQGLETRLENEGRVLKADLQRKGQTSGDGSWAGGNRAAGAAGASLSLVSGYGRGGIYSPANSKLPRPF